MTPEDDYREVEPPSRFERIVRKIAEGVLVSFRLGLCAVLACGRISQILGNLAILTHNKNSVFSTLILHSKEKEGY